MPPAETVGDKDPESKGPSIDHDEVGVCVETLVPFSVPSPPVIVEDAVGKLVLTFWGVMEALELLPSVASDVGVHERTGLPTRNVVSRLSDAVTV
jgi:hypothetical protein